MSSEQAQLRPPRGSGAHDAQGETGGAGFVQPGEKKAAGGSDYSFPLPKVKRYRRQPDFSQEVHSKRARGNGHKLQQGKFQLGHKENNFFSEWYSPRTRPSLHHGDFQNSAAKNSLSNT